MPRGLLAHWGERGAACPRGRAAIGTKAFSFPQQVGRIARRERVGMPKGKGCSVHKEGLRCGTRRESTLVLSTNHLSPLSKPLRCFIQTTLVLALPDGHQNPSLSAGRPVPFGLSAPLLAEKRTLSSRWGSVFSGSAALFLPNGKVLPSAHAAKVNCRARDFHAWDWPRWKRFHPIPDGKTRTRNRADGRGPVPSPGRHSS